AAGGIKMGLFKSAWDSDNSKKALRAVAKEPDQTKLIVIANSAPLREVREAAVKRFADQSAIEAFAKKTSDFSVCCAAIERLSNQTMLADIATHGKEALFRQAAVNNMNLTDQSVLSWVAKNDETNQVCYDAIQRLTDIFELEAVADSRASARHWVEIRQEELISRMTSQTELAYIAKLDIDSAIRYAAIRKLTDQSVLAELAKTDRRDNVRKLATERITDPSVLTELAEQDSSYSVRAIAVEKIADRAVLQHIFDTDDNEWVCATAKERLTGECREHDLVAIESERITSISGHTAQKFKCKRCGKIVELTGQSDNW
ncbi:MAG TPA: hypothetical protein DEB10_13430, partial [Ruminococcaceae bacterium]|nr:hypothetical protein [Oscillospiraceae bacterium]